MCVSVLRTEDIDTDVDVETDRRYVCGEIYMSIYLFLYNEIHYEALVHMTVEAGKSHSLPSTSWRPRKLVV